MAKSDKKVVRVESTPASKAEEARESNWKPTPEAKSKAIGFRVIAGVLWLLAIGTEAFAIFWVLRQNPVNLILLIDAGRGRTADQPRSWGVEIVTDGDLVGENAGGQTAIRSTGRLTPQAAAHAASYVLSATA